MGTTVSALASIKQAVANEFSGITDIEGVTVIILRLIVAVVMGAAIGYERERRGKDAGLRTHMLVSLGAAIFVLVPASSAMPPAEASRVMQGIIAGIGFLGAGAILKRAEGREVQGLTTAASIWVAAAIGICAGYGMEAIAIAGTLMALFVLAIIGWLER